jgi:hypothetical protein
MMGARISRATTAFVLTWLLGALLAVTTAAGEAATVVCTSAAGGRQHCPADTSAGVLLARSTGPAACQVIDVNHSPVSSTFGYYVGGQDGTTVSAAFSVFF